MFFSEELPLVWTSVVTVELGRGHKEVKLVWFRMPSTAAPHPCPYSVGGLWRHLGPLVGVL